MITELPPEFLESRAPEDNNLHFLENGVNDSESDLYSSEATLLLTSNDSLEALSITELLDANGFVAYKKSEVISPSTGILDERIYSYRILVNKISLHSAHKIPDSQNINSDSDHREFKEASSKTRTILKSWIGFDRRCIFYALTFLPMKGLDEPIKFAFFANLYVAYHSYYSHAIKVRNVGVNNFHTTSLYNCFEQLAKLHHENYNGCYF